MLTYLFYIVEKIGYKGADSQTVLENETAELREDFRTLYDFADPNHLLPTGKSSGKSKYVVPKIQPVRPSSVYAAAVT